MNGLEALKEIECDMEYVTRLDFVEPIVRGEVRDELKKIYWRELDQLDQIEKELKVLHLMKDYLLIEEKEELGLPCVIVSVRLPNKGTNPFYITHRKEEIELLKEMLG